MSIPDLLLNINREDKSVPLAVEKVIPKIESLVTAVVERMAHAYGSRIHAVLANCVSEAEMGEQILPGLYACEVRYLLASEFAYSAQDILWRRSKLGLHLPANAESILDGWIAQNRA